MNEIIKDTLSIYDYIILIFRFLSRENQKKFGCLNKKINKIFNDIVIKIGSLKKENKINFLFTTLPKRFPNFKLIDLSYYDLKEINILNMHNFTNISEINLGYNKDIKDYTPLYNLKNLKTLILYNNNLTNINFLEKLSSIIELDLGFNKNINNYKPLYYLNKLKILKLYNNNLNDINFLENNSFKNLEELSLGKNPNLKNYSPLFILKKLKILKLFYNDLSDISFLENLENLTVLNISHNLNIYNYNSLKILNNLQVLDLTNNDIKDFSFLNELNYCKLNYLNLYGNKNITLNKFSDLFEMLKGNIKNFKY